MQLLSQPQLIRTPTADDPSRRWLSLAAVCLGMTMTFLNITATISALSAIQADLHTSTTTLVWITSSYTLVVASLVLSAGTIGDLLGRRTVFMIGVAILAVGSLLAFTAGAAGVLIVAQAVMGLGGAMILPNSLAIVGSTFHDPHERTEAIGIWAACSGLGLAIGPISAGLLLQHFSWHSVFLVNIAVAVIVLVAAPLVVVNSRHAGRSLDATGLVLATLSIGSLTFAVIEGAHKGYTSPLILIAAATFSVTVALFITLELRHRDPMMDIRLFRSASFSAVMAIATSSLFGFTGVALLMVLFFQKAQGLSALATGWRLLPMMGAYVVVSSVAARVVRRVGFKVTLTAGLLLTAVGAALLLGLQVSSSFNAIWPGLTVFGLGSGLLLAPTTAAAVISVSHSRGGMASATVNMFRQLGGVLGASVLGSIFTAHFAATLPADLARGGVPTGVAAQVVSASTTGSPGASVSHAMGTHISTAVGHALSGAVHDGLLVAITVALVTAVPAAIFVRKRPVAA
jgi:EmrB/QacA subfamily drug resistance transporter